MSYFEYLKLKKIIKENLNEISTFGGGMEHSDSYEEVFDELSRKIGKKVFKSEILEYMKKVYGYKYTNLPKNTVETFSDVVSSKHFHWNDLPKQLKSHDLLSNIAYTLSKKFLKLKSAHGLEYYSSENPSSSRFYDTGRKYYFFDPEIEMSIGSIEIKQITDKYANITFPKDTWSVSISYLDKQLIGSGYGKKMYFIVLDTVDVLMSDTGLYEQSLNIWVNTLPKYYSVFAWFHEGEKNLIKKITRSTSILNHFEVKRYFATNNPQKIKLRTEKGKIIFLGS